MPQKCEAPAGKAGATRDLVGAGSRYPSSLTTQRAQFLALVHHVRPAMAELIACHAFGGER